MPTKRIRLVSLWCTKPNTTSCVHMPRRVKLNTTRPVTFPYHLVTHRPTTMEVHEMSKRFFAKKTIDMAQKYLPHLLDGKIYTERGVNRVLTQFTAGSDPYELYQSCQDLEIEFPELGRSSSGHGGNGGWLKSVCRLLICWVAEELKKQGHGNGFDDHFKITGNVSVPAIETPTVEVVAVSNVIDEDATMADDAATETFPCEDVPEDTTMTDDAQEPVHTRWGKPSSNVQRARTLGDNQELRQWLRTGAGNPKNKGYDFTKDSGAIVLGKVREYLRTPAGLELLMACDIHPSEATFDHVWPESMGGPDDLWNIHLMPKPANSHFSNRPWCDPEKRDYVGLNQMHLVEKLAMRARKEFRWQSLHWDD